MPSQTIKPTVFEKMGLPKNRVMLAPLAGVSDAPFWTMCSEQGAHLTYVEMLSAAALVHNSQRTWDMMRRHESEECVGLQVTARTADEMARAVEILDKENFQTIDINMGCPVKKVVKTGCGSAILQDPQRVYETTKAARDHTDKPLSVKIRLGWDHQSRNFLEVADAAEKGGAEWIVVHGRTRADDYSVPVDLDSIGSLKKSSAVPIIANGNLFCRKDVEESLEKTGCDGVMVSRGALGNPWLFRDLVFGKQPLSVETWLAGVLGHLEKQATTYEGIHAGVVAMRKHLLWYLKGWPGGKSLRDQLVRTENLRDSSRMIEGFAKELAAAGVESRQEVGESTESRFKWEPKFEMDRKLDRGVGDDGLDGSLPTA